MIVDAARETALKKILKGKLLSEFLLNEEYDGIALNKEVPPGISAHKLYEIYNKYMGFYNKSLGSFNECCLKESIAWGLSVNSSKNYHVAQHLSFETWKENTQKKNAWYLSCLTTEDINKTCFIIGLSAVKYPEVLELFFKNYKNDSNNPKGSLQKAYSNVPWSLKEAEEFTAFSDNAENNAVYQFIKYFPVELDKGSYLLFNESGLEKTLEYIENQIINGVNGRTIIDIWEYAKKELPFAFEFSAQHSSVLNQILSSLSIK